MNATAFGGLRLDGSTLSGSHVRTESTFAATRDQWFEISGAAPRIVLDTSFRNPAADAANRQNTDTSFLFSVPEAGWAAPVIYSETEDEMFAGLLGDGPGKYTIAIDPASPVLQTGRIRTVQLVAWQGGVDTNHVAIVEQQPKDVEVFYTYGWPSESKTPAVEGDLPTGIRAKLRGYGSTILIFR